MALRATVDSAVVKLTGEIEENRVAGPLKDAISALVNLGYRLQDPLEEYDLDRAEKHGDLADGSPLAAIAEKLRAEVGSIVTVVMAAFTCVIKFL